MQILSEAVTVYNNNDVAEINLSNVELFVYFCKEYGMITMENAWLLRKMIRHLIKCLVAMESAWLLSSVAKENSSIATTYHLFFSAHIHVLVCHI